MASAGRAVNPREEEKELDDKLMELGLLEPGMTLQEKRDMASVVLESTRMAEEQKHQRNAEEQWESLLRDPEALGSRNRSESPECIAISVSKPEPRGQSTSGAGNQNRRDDKTPAPRGTNSKGRGRIEKDVRERRKRERDEDITSKGEMIVLEVDEEDGRRVEARKDEGGRMWEFPRRKKEVDNGRKECETERPQKLLSVEESRDLRGKKEIEEAVEAREDKSKGGKNVEEKKGRKEVDVPQGTGQKGCPKVASVSDEKTAADTQTGRSFYGPTCSSNAKELNPLRSELHGYSRKRGPPRSSQVSLLQLAKEEVPQRKKSLDDAEIEELVLDDETSHETSNCDEAFVRVTRENKSSAEARDAEDRRLFLERHMSGRKVMQERAEVGKSGDDIIDDGDWETPQGGLIWLKESRKRNGAGESPGPSGLREGALPSFRGKSERTLSLLAGAGKMKRKEQDMQGDTEEGSEVDDDEKGVGELNASGRSDFIIEGKKKRRLAKGTSSKKWVDVVIFPNASCTGASDGREKETPKSIRKINLPPNKRWRRVKRKAKSSFGSGSEVDEWISSEEEQKSQSESFSKEQLIARFDEQLNYLKVALKEDNTKKASCGSKYSRCKLCEKKSTMKVPPGFQEPDSDDEWNLWKICFSKPPSDSTEDKLKPNSKKEKAKPDAIPLMYRSAVTRSQTKQIGDLRTRRSESKSPTFFEDNAFSSTPEAQGKAPGVEIIPSDEITVQNKSPVFGEVMLLDKVIQSQPCATVGTQTSWQNGGTESANSSCGNSLSSGPKSKGGSKVDEPVWDLLEIDSEGEEVVRKPQGTNGGGSEKVEEAFKNVTMRRVRSESPEYLPLRQSNEDTPPSLSTAVCSRSVGRKSESLLHEPVEVPSPVIPRGPKRGKLRAVEGKTGECSMKTDRVQSKGKKVDTHDLEDEESEEVQEIQPPPRESNEDDLPEAVPCPICDREFPISEIEVHASECNPEEEDPLPRSLRDGARNRPRVEMDVREASGATHQHSDVEMRECEADMGDDEFDAACSSQEHAPRPAPLSTYIPISQQKNSLIDYSDQFPHRSTNVDLQATLSRMRQSLLSRVRKKTRWRRKRKPRWKSKKF